MNGDALSKSEIKENKTWKTTKKIPISLIRPGNTETVSSDIVQKQLARKKKYIENRASEAKSSFAPRIENIEIEERRERKKQSRLNYERRIATRGIRRLCNPLHCPEISEEVRLNIFNKRNKCPCHKMRYNVINTVDGKLRYSCDRSDKREQTTHQTHILCPNCRQQELFAVDKNKCVCKITLCNYCKMEQYTVDGVTRIICHCGYCDDSSNHAAFLMRNVRKTRRNRWMDNQVKDTFLKDMMNLKIDIKPVTKEYDEEFPTLVQSHGGTASFLKSTADAAVTVFIDFCKDILAKVKRGITMARTAMQELKAKAHKIYGFVKMSHFFQSVLEVIGNIIGGLVKYVQQNMAVTPMIIKELIELVTRDSGPMTKAAQYAVFVPIITEIILESENVKIPYSTEIWEFFKNIWAIFFNIDDDHGYKYVVGNDEVTTHSYDKDGREITAVNSDGRTTNAIRDGYDKTVALLSKVMGCRSPVTVVGGLRDFNTLFIGVRNIGTLISNFSVFLPSFVKRMFLSVEPRAMMRSEFKKRDSAFYKFNETAIALMIAKTARDEVSMIRLEAELTKTHENLLNYLKENNIGMEIEIVRYIDNMLRQCRLTGQYGPTPDEPFIIRASGDSGVGKTTLSYALLSPCYPGMSQDKMQEQTYNRNPVAETWDGCIKGKHKVCIFDDFNQDREEGDLRDLILLASRTVFLPQFASIDPNDAAAMGNKGDVVSFDVILLNSNSTQIRANTLNSNEAINRRKNIHYEFNFKPGLKIGDARNDFSHLVVTALNQDYKPIWRVEGLEGIKKAQMEICVAYRKHQKRRNDITQIVDNLVFKVEDVPQEHNEVLGGSRNGPPYSGQITRVDSDSNYDYYLGLAGEVCHALAAGATSSWVICLGLEWLNKMYCFPEFRMMFGSVFVISTLAIAFSSFMALQAMKTDSHSGENATNKHEVRIKSHGEVVPLYQTLKKNTFRLEVGEGITKFTNGFFVKGNVALINAHLFWSTENKGSRWVPDGTPMKLYNYLQKEPTVIRFDHTKLVVIRTEVEERDLVLYQFPRIVQARPTLTQHFWEGDIDLTNRKVVSIQHKFDGCDLYFGDVVKDQMTVTYENTQYGKPIKVFQHSACRISVPSQRGDCGSITFIDDPMIQAKIVGVNVGSCGRESVTIFVTHATLMKHLAHFDVCERADMHSGWREPNESDFAAARLEGNLVLHAVAEKTMVPSGRSKIRQSPLFDLIETHVTEPCIVNLKDPRLHGRNTFLESLNKYSQPSLPLPHGEICEAVKSIRKDLMSIKTIRLKRFLTTFEAINGVEGYPYLDSLDMTTSAGFPFTCEGIVGEKRQLFDGNSGCYTPNNELQAHIDIIENRLKIGVLPDYPYIDTLKDERKPLEDVAQGKVRMFSMNNVALCIVMRKIFLPVIAHFYQCRHQTFLSIGINKASREWDIMVNYLLEVSQTFFDFDYKKFDTRANLDTRVESNEIFIEEWMNDIQQKMARTALFYDSQAMHYFLKFLVLLPSGTSSGSIMTAICGSILNEAYIRVAWQNIMPVPLCDLRYYKEHVRTKNYGDDLAMTVSDAVKHLFNDKNIAQFLAKYNIEMTPGSKTGDWGERTLGEFTFLKNNTRKYFGQYVPLAQNPCEQINWIKIGLHAETPEKACEANCNSALRMLFFYGQEQFDNVRSKIIDHRPEYELVSYGPLLREFLQYGEICDVDGAFAFGSSRMGTAQIIKHYERDSENGITNVDSHSGSENKMDFKKDDGKRFEAKCRRRMMCHQPAPGYDTIPVYKIKGDTAIFKYVHTKFYYDGMKAQRIRPLFVVSIDDELFYVNPYEICVIEINNDGQREAYFETAEGMRALPGNEDAQYILDCLTEQDTTFVDLIGKEDLKVRMCEYHTWFWRQLEQENENDFTSDYINVFPNYYHYKTDRCRSDTIVVESHSGSGTLDEAASIQEQKVGVALSDQTKPTLTHRTSKPSATNQRAEAYNNDDSWTLEKMLSRWNLVDTIVWSTVTPPGSNIAVLDIVADMLTNDIASTPFLRFEKFRCDRIKLRFECIGYRFCRGSLLGVIHNTMVPKSQLNSTVMDIRKAITLQHITLDPAEGTVAEMAIEFAYNKQYMDLVNGDSLGQLYLTVQNQIVPGTSGPGEASIKVFMSVDGAEFKQPRPGSTTFRVAQASDVFIPYERSERHVEVESHSGIVNGLIDTGADALKDLAKTLIPDEVISDALGGILDKVQIGEQYGPVTTKDMGYVSNTRNVEYVDILTADPSSQQLSDANVFGTGINEMMIDSIIKEKAGFVETVQWKATDPVGKVLFSDDVGPMSTFPETHNPSTPNYLMPIDMVSHLFAFWRGGIIYFFQIVGTLFHEGKIDINYHPTLNKATGESLTPHASVTQYTLSHFLRNGGNMIGVTCPYLGDTPVKKVWSGQLLVDKYTPNTEGLRFADYFSGSITLRVSAPLNSPNTVQPDVEINVYKMCAKDYQLFMNTLTGSSIQFTDDIVRIDSHSGSSDKTIIRNSPFSTMATTMLAAGEGTSSDVPNSQFGEYFKSLRDLCKKYQPLRKGSFVVNLANLTADQLKGVAPFVGRILISDFNGPSGTSGYYNFIGKMAKCYRLYRGPLNFKYRIRAYAIPKVPAANGLNISARTYITPQESNMHHDITDDTSYLFPSNDFPGIVSRQVPSMAYASSTQIAEFKVPMLSNRTSGLVQHLFDNATDVNQYYNENYINASLYFATYLEGLPQAPALAAQYDIIVESELLVSFADETMFGVWIGPPKASIITDETGLTAIGPDQWTFTARKGENNKKPAGRPSTAGGFKQK